MYAIKTEILQYKLRLSKIHQVFSTQKLILSLELTSCHPKLSFLNIQFKLYYQAQLNIVLFMLRERYLKIIPYNDYIIVLIICI